MEPNPAGYKHQVVSHMASALDDAAESERLAAALHLKEILREEAGILRRFAGSELLWLIPKKELLVGELGRQLKASGRAGEDAAPLSEPLKDLLREIDQLNRSNGLFIQKTLSHWRDLLSIFSPRTYGPAGEGVRPRLPAIRGHAFSREV